MIVYHEVQPSAFPVCANPDTDDNCVGPYDTKVSDFTAQLASIGSAGLGANVVTVQQALAEIATPAPSAPVVTGGPVGVVKAATATFTVAPAAGSTFEYRLDEPSDGPWTPGVSPLQLSGLGDGAHTLEVRGVAAAQHSTVVTRTWTVDGTPPTATIDSGPAADTTATTATFTFSADDPDAQFQASLDNSTYADVTSGIKYSGLAVGAHTFHLRATDKTGNTSAEVTHAWTISPAPPVVTGGPNGVVKDKTATFTVAPAAGSTFEYRLDKPSDGPWTPGVSPLQLTGLGDGAHTLEVRGVAGAQHSTVVTRTWTVDGTPPTATIDSAPAADTTATTATFTFSADDPDAQFQASLDNGAYADVASGKSYAGLAVGAHTFHLRATDKAGNTSAEVTHGWTISPEPPVITGGPAAPVPPPRLRGPRPRPPRPPGPPRSCRGPGWQSRASTCARSSRTDCASSRPARARAPDACSSSSARTPPGAWASAGGRSWWEPRRPPSRARAGGR